MDNFSIFFEEVDAVLISSVTQITFLTGYSNFSPVEREAYILVTPNNKYLFTDARYTEAVSNLPGFKLLELSAQTSLNDHLKILSSKNKIKKLGIEDYNLTVGELRKLEKIFSQIKGIKLGTIRSVKTSDQINKIERACRIGDKGFKWLLKHIGAGISEKELAYQFEKYVRKNDAVLSFDTIIAFGANSAIPHHHTSSEKLKAQNARSGEEGVFVKMDFGVKVDNYCSDMTRTVFYGKASAKQKKIYQTVLEAQIKAAGFLDKQIRVGKKVLGKEVDKVARDFIISQGFSSIPHGLGHGIGLEVHEAPRLSPRSDDELKEGMVFSIEPGIYISGYGGVRIEDLFVIEKNKLKQLTSSSKDIIEL